MRLVLRVLRQIFSSLFLATVVVVGAPIAFAATILAGLVFLPLPASIPVPKASANILPTLIYDRYGHVIATISGFDKNLPFAERDVPAILEEAVIADEDRNYYHENGIDLRGMARALVADLRNRAPVQGGSTITQQYVKLAFTGSQRTVLRKIREAILASQLSREASKAEILYHYLTLIYLGDGNYGAAAATNTYFHEPMRKLNPSQAATLAGLIPAPTYRNPDKYLSSAEAARRLVLKKMYEQHYLTYDQYLHWLGMPLALWGTPAASEPNRTIVYPDAPDPPSPYPDFVNYVNDWLHQNIPASVLAGGGLRIQTTLDPATENDMLQVEKATLTGASSTVDMAMVAVEPQTGFVQALVGGKDFGTAAAGKLEDVNLALGGCQSQAPGAHVQVAASCWKNPMITGGGGGRQPGSSFKPFTLATAFSQNIPPSTSYPAPFSYQIPNCQVAAGQDPSKCQIHNDEGDSGVGGTMTLADATAFSINTVYSQVAEQVGCPNVATTASKLGIETAYYATPPFYYCASYALGELGVSPLDMASAYGVFADHGQRAAPTPILEIVNSTGKVLVDNIHHLPRTTAVLPANVADNVTDVLQGVIQHGTGTSAQLGRPAAGKTGTTSNNTDAWFVGYTPTLSTAVWMGDPYSDAVPVGYSTDCPKGCVTGQVLGGGSQTYYGLYGAEWPAISWKEFMGLALASVPATAFSAPAPIYTPQEAAALQAASTTTTTGVVQAGPAGEVQSTPLGGPYVQPVTPPVAPPPPTTTTTSTTIPDTSTTLFPGDTTTSSPPGTG